MANPQIPIDDKKLQWPVAGAELARLKKEHAKPVPRVLWQCPLPEPHRDRSEEDWERIKRDSARMEKQLQQRVVCQVSILASIIVDKRFQGIQIYPSGYGIKVPVKKWVSLPLAAVELLERMYVGVDLQSRLRKGMQPDTTQLGFLYTRYFDWQYDVERWNLEEGGSFKVPRLEKPEPAEAEEDQA